MKNQSSGRLWRFWIRLMTKPFSHFYSTCTALAYRYSIASFLIIKESFRIHRRSRVFLSITFQTTPPNARCSITTAAKGQETGSNGRLQMESDPLCIQQSSGGANKKSGAVSTAFRLLFNNNFYILAFFFVCVSSRDVQYRSGFLFFDFHRERSFRVSFGRSNDFL